MDDRHFGLASMLVEPSMLEAYDIAMLGVPPLCELADARWRGYETNPIGPDKLWVKGGY